MLSQKDVYTSPLVMLSFNWRSNFVSAEESASLTGWLMEEFLLHRCAFLASAVSRTIGRDHFVAWKHPDGQLAHAVVSVSPQFNPHLRGDGMDILGRRSLKDIDAQVRTLVPSAKIEVASPIEETDFERDDEATMLALAIELPWFRKLLRLEDKAPDGICILTLAEQLGWQRQPDL